MKKTEREAGRNPCSRRREIPQKKDSRKEQMPYRQHRLHRIVIKKGKRKGSLSKELQKHTNLSEVYKQKNPRGVDHSGDSE